MSENVYITITDGRPRALWRQRLWAVAYPLILIGAGVAMDSAAMQWLGFVAVVFALVVAIAVDKGRRLTIAEARTFLDEMEAR